MRIFNKIITIITLILLLPLITMLLALPEFALSQVRLGVDSLEALLATFVGNERLIMLAIAAGLDLLILGLLFANLRRPPRESAPIRLKKGGVAEVAFHAIAQRIQISVSELPGVIEVIPYIEAPRRRVFVTLDVAIANYANVPQTAAEIVRVVQQTVGEDMGLAMAGKPSIRIRQTPQGKGNSNPAANKPGRAVRLAPPRPPGRDAEPTRPMINEEDFRS